MLKWINDLRWSLYIKNGWCWIVSKHRFDWKDICVDCGKKRPPFNPETDSVW